MRNKENLCGIQKLAKRVKNLCKSVAQFLAKQESASKKEKNNQSDLYNLWEIQNSEAINIRELRGFCEKHKPPRGNSYLRITDKKKRVYSFE